jgi:hypothetical protein
MSSYGGALERLARVYEADAEVLRDLLQEIHIALWRSFAGTDTGIWTASSAVQNDAGRGGVGGYCWPTTTIMKVSGLGRGRAPAAAGSISAVGR